MTSGNYLCGLGQSKGLMETQMNNCWQRSSPEYESFMRFGSIEIKASSEYHTDNWPTVLPKTDAARVNAPSSTGNHTQPQDDSRQHKRQASIHRHIKCVVAVSYSPSHAPEGPLW